MWSVWAEASSRADHDFLIILRRKQLRFFQRALITGLLSQLLEKRNFFIRDDELPAAASAIRRGKPENGSSTVRDGESDCIL